MSAKDNIDAAEWLARAMFAIIVSGAICVAIERFSPETWAYIAGLFS